MCVCVDFFLRVRTFFGEDSLRFFSPPRRSVGVRSEYTGYGGSVLRCITGLLALLFFFALFNDQSLFMIGFVFLSFSFYGIRCSCRNCGFVPYHGDTVPDIWWVIF